MNWTEWLYHDHTPYYTSTLAGSLGGRVTVRLRAPLEPAVSAAQLVILEHGDLKRIPMREVRTDEHFRFYQAELPLLTPTMRYVLFARTESDSAVLGTRGASRTVPPFRDWFQFVCDRRNASWLEDRVFYQIFPDRFKDSDAGHGVKDGEYQYDRMRFKPDGSFEVVPHAVVRRGWGELPTRETNILEHFGGDLGGIEMKLDYLEGLGVNALYLNPIFKSPSNHRYDTEDFLEVDPHLGGDAALKGLLDAAHARDMRVILDNVVDHTGDRHPLFLAARDGGPEREFYSFNERFGRLGYAAFFGVPSLPKVEYASLRAQEHFITGPDSPVRKWIRFGADGWRIDVAHMIGANGSDVGNLEIHHLMREAVRLENPDAYVFGERFLDAEAALQGPDVTRSLNGATVGGEDGVMNYQGFGLPVTDWLAGRNVWDIPVQVPTTEVAARLFESWRVLPEQSRRAQYNLFGSHDIPRALHRFSEDAGKLQTAFALLFAFPGVPSVYYGDEIGMTGGGDPFNRAPMIWDESRWNQDVYQAVQKLAQARRTSNALKSGSLVWLHADGDEIAFARPFTDESGSLEVAIVAVSREHTPKTVRLEISRTGALGGTWQDVVSGERFTARNGVLEVSISSPRVLLPV